MANFPSLHQALKKDKDDDLAMRRHIEEVFETHHILPAPSSKSWSIGRGAHTWTYGFRVVWLPGNLHLSGDLGEMALTHYHAMPTWKEAVDWVDRADFDYLIGKSDAKMEFNQQKTAIEMVRMAEDYYEEGDESSFWDKIFEYLDGAAFMGESGKTEWFDSRVVANDLDRKLAAKLLIDEFYSDLTPDSVYNTFEIPDFGGVYNHNHRARWLYEAFRLWAKLVKDSQEYKNLEKKTNVEAVS